MNWSLTLKGTVRCRAVNCEWIQTQRPTWQLPIAAMRRQCKKIAKKILLPKKLGGGGPPLNACSHYYAGRTFFYDLCNGSYLDNNRAILGQFVAFVTNYPFFNNVRTLMCNVIIQCEGRPTIFRVHTAMPGQFEFCRLCHEQRQSWNQPNQPNQDRVERARPALPRGNLNEQPDGRSRDSVRRRVDNDAMNSHWRRPVNGSMPNDELREPTVGQDEEAEDLDDDERQ